MPKTQNRAVMNWIYTFTAFAAFLVVFGGFVRLTRSGLSIVEWNPVYGAIPPITQQQWQTEFAKYQLTPEYIKVNSGMTLDQYKIIFFLEWFHRLVARLAGFVFAIPFFYFAFKKIIPWKEIWMYVLLGLLFVSQAIMGWIMVSSGLEDRPSVSHYALTAHLFFALTLIGLSLWTAFGHRFGFSDGKTKWSTASKIVAAGLVVLLIQIAYGGFTAGLKAGHISNTWPLMLGQLVPHGLLAQVSPPLMNLFEAPVTVVFIHRWFAFVGLIVAGWVYWQIRKQNFPAEIMNGIHLTIVLVIVQIVLGILVILFNVNIALALIHQANAIALFAATIYVLHRLRAADAQA